MKRFLSFFSLLSVLLLFVACGEIEHPNQVLITRGNYRYQGGFANGKYNGYGCLTYGDSVVYEGQWKNGLRQGQGICTDAEGRMIVGGWKADTLVSGLGAESLGVYRSDFDRQVWAAGRGC